MGYMSARKIYDPYMGVGLNQEQEMTDATPKVYVPQNQVVQVQQPDQMNAGVVAQGAASGAMMGGPTGAAIGAGGAFLTQYIAQRAADERAKREAIGRAYEKQATDEQNIYNTIMSNNTRALR